MYHPRSCEICFYQDKTCTWTDLETAAPPKDYKCDRCANLNLLCDWPSRSPCRRPTTSKRSPPALPVNPPKPVFRKTPAPQKPPKHSTSRESDASNVPFVKEESIHVNQYVEQLGEEAKGLWFTRHLTFEEKIRMVGGMTSKLSPVHPTIILTERMNAVLLQHWNKFKSYSKEESEARVGVSEKFKDLVAETLLSMSNSSNSAQPPTSSSSSRDKGKKRALNQD
ncbi:uncharacterized protein MELLADRAFT_84105 [Melampsora larici-populina 98AG31]|uniref:Uncharacterized protein n=1 Tax=Melampsora larici-populina (strain 98AG31 / pathotype 3-4-7) TaxID=747676 RepID=F4SBI4_MELLP|nr:uncharacterized protein MELLADRAFT_84105 [Melampsora larici-populina 98AG31]EGF97998.1 hypothetical protein MELLADRAFT_84105 [Melampsora larici-populina 98AG31]